ncbi:MAG TPA: GatB/YqeY domain-containing protein [Bacillota bacterium]|nr:GatB/YqeY domain-containing protein [Bacillota bacterium]
MSTMQSLQEEIKNAMKNKENVRLSVLRMIKAAAMNAQIAKGSELDDAEILQIIAKELKQRQDTIPDYEKANRPDMLEKLREEIEIIKGYLPQQLNEGELREIVSQTIVETGASGPKEMGKVMGALMPKVRGRADGQLVNKLVRELLNS